MSGILITGYKQKPSSSVTDGSQNSVRKLGATLLSSVLEDVNVNMAYNTPCEPGNVLAKSDSKRKKHMQSCFFFFFNLLYSAFLRLLRVLSFPSTMTTFVTKGQEDRGF